MSETNQYLIFTVNLNNLAQIVALQGTGGVTGGGVGAILDVAPDTAALGPFNSALHHYAAPILLKRDKFVVPSITSEWFGTSNQFPTNVGFFDRKSGGWFGWSFLFGDTTHYHWRGVFNYVAPDTVQGPVAVPITTRRWVDGFEVPVGGEEPANLQGMFSRGASRHPDGLGFNMKGFAQTRNHTTIETLGGTSPRSSWERFYVRLRQLPSVQTCLWRARSAVSPAAGFAIYVSITGQLVLYEVDSVGGLTFIATSSLVLANNVWQRIDIFVGMGINGIAAAYGQPVFGGVILWQNGIQRIFYAQGPSPGNPNPNVQANSDRHTSSELGHGATNSLGIDIDDWINAAIPQQNLGPNYVMDVRGVDWQNGTKITLINPTAINAGVNWVGDFRALLQNPLTSSGANTAVTSSTAAAVLTVDTDAKDTLGAQPNGIGIVSIMAIINATTVLAGATLGFIGADLVIGTLTGAITQAGTSFMRWLVSMANGVNTLPIKIAAPVQITHTHGSIGLETVRTLVAVAEVAGTFGPEDAGYVASAALSLDNTPQTAPLTIAPSLGPHNSAYPRTPWARQTTTPQQPVFVRGGTYVGNGTGQDLLFPIPINFFWSRPVGSASPGTKWFTSLMGAHRGIELQVVADGMVQALVDPDFVPGAQDTQQMQVKLRVMGATLDANQNGVTYQYVAIGDPGMRFMLNGMLAYHKGALDVVTTLINAGFTPIAAWLWAEQINGSTTGSLNYKGPGHALATSQYIGAAETPTSVQFGAGTITTKSAYTNGAGWDGAPFSAWRTNDGGTTLGATNAGRVVQLFSYTGDGNATRTIICTPISGRRPMFAMILPHSTGAAIWRDPSHTGTTSSAVSGGTANAATGIIGGDIDQISIGSALNALGIVYDVFCIPGDTTAGNAGWGVNVDVIPVDPNPPPTALGDPAGNGPEPPNPAAQDPVVPIVIPDPLPPAGAIPGLTDDLDPTCITQTMRVINGALGRIGVSKAIVDAALDVTLEATELRLQYTDAVEQTLRDFEWPFATRYVQLAILNAGATPNSDWLYAYRQPVDCLFERRLVVKREGAIDPAPVPFQLSTDDTGGIIFCNVGSAVLEYTARPKCPHTRSEPLFRDAVTWKLAARLAPALSRMTDAAINCEKMYQTAIEQARLVLRPGNPGEQAAVSVLDTTAAQLAANVAVINAGLVRIGARTIRNLTTDQSPNARTARLVFEQELRSTLRDFPWSFATVYYAPALVGGTATVPVNADWQYSYRMPTDVVFLRRIVSSLGRDYDPCPITFKLAQDATGPLLFTNQAITTSTPVTIEYTNRPAGVVAIADDLFRDALAWRLAWVLAPSLAEATPDAPAANDRGPADPTKPGERPSTLGQLRARTAAYALEMYQRAILKARTASANESQPTTIHGDADWIRGR